jgi:hypothetical protein
MLGGTVERRIFATLQSGRKKGTAMGNDVFVSYARENVRLAESIALAIRDYNWSVFFDKDRDNLPPGRGYHKKIHDEINGASVFVFLISQESIGDGSYALTELKFAQEKWPHPRGRVLPAQIGPYDRSVLPPYLNAATKLSIRGSSSAEIAKEVNELLQAQRLSARWKRTIQGILKGGVGKCLAFVNAKKSTNTSIEQAIREAMGRELGSISVSDLKERLKSDEIPSGPIPVRVRGVFFPGALMSFGWWERKENQLITDIKWKDPSLQGWFFSGFEQWAPSWDVNDWSDKNPIKLVGQIGEGDEANSIPVLVKGEERARKLRDEFHDKVVLNANVVALLCHETHLEDLPELSEADKHFLDAIKRVTDSQYYLLVPDSDNAARYDVELRTGPVNYYSGYLWQCWAPKEWKGADADGSRLVRSYFVWEHCNLANNDVVQFGMDALAAKVELLRKRLQKDESLKAPSGDLVLLQHLMAEQKLRGEASGEEPPAIPADEFSNWFTSKDVPKS